MPYNETVPTKTHLFYHNQLKMDTFVQDYSKIITY